jgi:hypothetical protein
MLNTGESSSDMELLNMRCALAALDVELKLCRLIYLLRKYSPSQPRLPAGSPGRRAVDERRRERRHGRQR